MLTIAKLYEATNDGMDIVKWVYPQVEESSLELRSTKKYGQVCYVQGNDGKWYNPLAAYMLINNIDSSDKDQFKGALQAIAEHFGCQDDKEKNKNKDVIDEQLINEISKQYLCIGGKWFKKSLDPITKQEELYPVNPKVMIDSDGHPYSKDIVERVRDAAPQYLARTNIPSHVDYAECVINGMGDRFYNEYRPICYIPKEGTWVHIEQVIRHIFGEQYEMGLDYFQLLYLQPLHPLPILLLVSTQTGTGKSTFCKLVQAIFGANALPLTTAIFESRFNSYWTGKLVVYVEEQESDSKEERKQSAKIKNAVTAEKLPSEGKGKDPKLVNNYVKVIICSNDELTPVKIEPEDTRFWVRQIPTLEKSDESIDILSECKDEIPAFLFSLLHRKMSTKRENRLWFRPEDFRTPAWRKIVNGSKTSIESSLIEMLGELMESVSIRSVSFTALELVSTIKSSMSFSDKDKREISTVEIRKILHDWGLKASKKNVRHKHYVFESNRVKILPNNPGKAFTVTKELIESQKTIC
jgi:hypothetical protein